MKATNWNAEEDDDDDDEGQSVNKSEIVLLLLSRKKGEVKRHGLKLSNVYLLLFDYSFFSSGLPYTISLRCFVPPQKTQTNLYGHFSPQPTLQMHNSISIYGETQ